jgi:hypothetical protein
MNLSAIEQATLSRKIAQSEARIKRLEQLLKGQPIGMARFLDAVITNAKIEGLSVDKLESGYVSVGEKILVKDEDGDNRILITNDEIRISKPGVDVEEEITETNKKDFILLSTADADKLVIATMVEGTSYAHNLGYVPWFLAFGVDSASNPTEFRPLENSPWGGAVGTTTQILGLSNPTYLMIFHRNT